MIQLLIFDMAGTAVNEDNLVYKTMQSVLVESGLDISLETVLLHGAGKEKQGAISDIIFELDGLRPKEDRVRKLYFDFKFRLEAAYDLYPLEIFPSVKKIISLSRAQGMKVAFNTGYPKVIAERILEKTKVTIGKDIDLLMTADQVANSRPAPDMINAICERLQIDASKAIKVGDSAIDIEEGKAAGVKYSIGITTGAQSRSMLKAAQPDFIIDDMLELQSIIEQA